MERILDNKRFYHVKLLRINKIMKQLGSMIAALSCITLLWVGGIFIEKQKNLKILEAKRIRLTQPILGVDNAGLLSAYNKKSQDKNLGFLGINRPIQIK